MDKLILVPILLPMVAGIGLFGSAFLEYIRAAKRRNAGNHTGYAPAEGNLRTVHLLTLVVLLVSAAAALYIAWTK